MAYKTEKLKAKVLEKYDNQKAFAKALGIPQATLSRYLNGREWKGSTLVKAVALLEIPVDQIYTYFFEPEVSKQKQGAKA